MQFDRLSRHLLVAFALAVILYVTGYWLIESRRILHTPWQVRFTAEPHTHSLLLTVAQQSLKLGPTQIRIPFSATNTLPAPAEFCFDQIRPVPFPVPGGQCVFQDATFMPGTVALEIAGVPVQLLPRILTVGTNEHSWVQTYPVEVPPPTAGAAE
jgi:hypothetical protein